MKADQLRDLFFQTGRPELYCLARQRARREEQHTQEKGERHAPDHPGHRPAGDQL